MLDQIPEVVSAVAAQIEIAIGGVAVAPQVVAMEESKRDEHVEIAPVGQLRPRERVRKPADDHAPGERNESSIGTDTLTGTVTRLTI